MLHQSVKIDVVIWLHDGIGRHEGLWKIFLQKFKFNFHLMFAIFTCIKNLIK